MAPTGPGSSPAVRGFGVRGRAGHRFSLLLGVERWECLTLHLCEANGVILASHNS